MPPEKQSAKLKPAFRPKSLPAQLLEVLRDDIASGKIGPVLPGERQLALAYHVSRATMRHVIEVLEKESALERRPNGRLASGGRKTRRDGRPAALEHIAFLTRFHMYELSRFELIWMDLVREMLTISGYRLTYHNRPDIYHREPDSQLEHLVAENPKTIWLLHRSTPAMQAYFLNNKIPAVIVGSPHEGCSLPFVDKDQYALSFNAVCLAKRRGYNHLVYLHTIDPAAGVRLGAQGLEAGIRQTKMRLTSRRYQHDVFSILDRVLAMPDLKRERSVLLVDYAHTALRVMTYLMGRGLRIPSDLGMLCRDSASYLNECCPAIVHYTADPRVLAQKLHRCVMRLSYGESLEGKVFRILPTLVKGGSL